MIKIPLRILLIEDNEADIFITVRTLKKLVENPVIEVIEDISACRHMLVNFVPDVVISDYNLPTCTGLDILQLMQQKDANLPLIFLTGTVHDEELAANTVLTQAFGFVLKKDMSQLDQKLKPMLKKVVFGMVSSHDLREKLRKNKIAVNQIYDYLDSMHEENIEQKLDIKKIRADLQNFKMEENENS